MISVASEVMAILCLASDMADLKRRFGDILVAYNYQGEPVYARDLKAEGAMAALMTDALKPNLVQTLEGTPCPHARRSRLPTSPTAATQSVRPSWRLSWQTTTITEAGFGADLGAEKFMDIKCRKAGLAPDCVVLVATVRALKYNGGVAKDQLRKEDIPALTAGLSNLKAHIENLKKYGAPVIVAINQFETDTADEISAIKDTCRKLGADFELSRVFAEGGRGGTDLARAIVRTIEEKPSHFHVLYEDSLSIKEKIETIAREIYNAGGVEFSAEAVKKLRDIEQLGRGMPVCMAKTQYSLSDNRKLLGRPEGFTIHVGEVRLSAGAGFIVVQTGDIMTMPGLPKVPAANQIDVDEDGQILGLF